MRNALAAVLVPFASPHGFTVTGFADQIGVMTGQNTTDYSTRHASYDLRKIRERPGRQTRPDAPATTSHPKLPTIAALLTLPDQVIAPIIAGVRPRRAANRSPGPRSTATTKPCASFCKPCSLTLASRQPRQQRHRQKRCRSGSRSF